MKDHLVAALIYDDLCTFEFGCVVEIFGIRRAELDVEWYRFGVCSMDRGPVRAAGGVTIESRSGLSLLDRAQTIIVPGWRDSGPGHWQSLWAEQLQGAERVTQDDWVAPTRRAWVGSLVVGVLINVSTLWVPTELKIVGALVVIILVLLI